jgi:hypothetical protein
MEYDDDPMTTSSQQNIYLESCYLKKPTHLYIKSLYKKNVAYNLLPGAQILDIGDITLVGTDRFSPRLVTLSCLRTSGLLLLIGALPNLRVKRLLGWLLVLCISLSVCLLHLSICFLDCSLVGAVHKQGAEEEEAEGCNGRICPFRELAVTIRQAVDYARRTAPHEEGQARAEGGEERESSHHVHSAQLNSRFAFEKWSDGDQASKHANGRECLRSLPVGIAVDSTQRAALPADATGSLPDTAVDDSGLPISIRTDDFYEIAQAAADDDADKRTNDHEGSEAQGDFRGSVCWREEKDVSDNLPDHECAITSIRLPGVIL